VAEPRNIPLKKGDSKEDPSKIHLRTGVDATYMDGSPIPRQLWDVAFRAGIWVVLEAELLL